MSNSEEIQNAYIDEFGGMSPWISVCCGSRPFGEVYEVPDCDPIGICSCCHDNTCFEREGIED